MPQGSHFSYLQSLMLRTNESGRKDCYYSLQPALAIFPLSFALNRLGHGQRYPSGVTFYRLRWHQSKSSAATRGSLSNLLSE